VGEVRKTPYIFPGRTRNHARLSKSIDEIGTMRLEEGQVFEDDAVLCTSILYLSYIVDTVARYICGFFLLQMA